MIGIIEKHVSLYGLLYLDEHFGAPCKYIQIIDFIEDRVGTAGFEPTASCTPSKRATRLRHVPINW